MKNWHFVIFMALWLSLIPLSTVFAIIFRNMAIIILGFILVMALPVGMRIREIDWKAVFQWLKEDF